MRRVRVFLRTTFIFFALLVVVGAGVWHFYGDRITLWAEGWAKARLTELYVRQVQPHLPFKIESVDVDADWKDFRAGRLKNVKLSLRWQTWRAQLSGPAAFSLESSGDTAEATTIRYSPITWIGQVGKPATRTSPIPLKLQATIATRFSWSWKQLFHLKELGVKPEAIPGLIREISISTHPKEFKWDLYGAQLTAPALDVVWRGGKASVSFSAKSVAWNAPSKNGDAVTLEEPSLGAEDALAFSPFHVGEALELHWSGKTGEALFGNDYAELPLSEISGNASVRVDHRAGKPIELRSARAWIGPRGGASKLELSAELHSPTEAQIEWKTKPLELGPLERGLLALSDAGTVGLQSLGALHGIDISGGAFETHGSAELKLPLDTQSLPQAQGALKITGLRLKAPKLTLAARGVDVDVSGDTASGADARVSAQGLFFRRLTGSLDPLTLRLRPAAAGAWSLSTPAGVPVRFSGLPFRIGSLSGTLRPGAKDPADVYEIHTALKLDPTRLDAFNQPFCLGMKRVPPAQVSVDLSDIDLTPGSIDPTGRVHVAAFGGGLDIDNLALFDLLTDSPELDLDARWDRIRLDQLGDWSGFGEMDGILVGHAKDVVLASWIPTHYDFEIRAMPLHHRHVEFSPDAVENLATIVSGGVFPTLPLFGIYRFTDHLLGNFSINYAGFSLFSNDGLTLLETFDPQSSRPSSPGQQQTHYILYNWRFQIPIRSAHYPVVVDQSSLGIYVRMIAEGVKKIAANKSASTEEKNHAEDNPTQKNCFAPDF